MVFDCEAYECIHNYGDGDCDLTASGINLDENGCCDSFERKEAT